MAATWHLFDRWGSTGDTYFKFIWTLTPWELATLIVKQIQELLCIFNLYLGRKSQIYATEKLLILAGMKKKPLELSGTALIMHTVRTHTEGEKL